MEHTGISGIPRIEQIDAIDRSTNSCGAARPLFVPTSEFFPGVIFLSKSSKSISVVHSVGECT